MKYYHKYEKYDLYMLKKDIPLAKKDTIFYYDPNDNVRGSVSEGCLKLAWDTYGCSQDTCCFCEDTLVFHADALNDKGWFKLVKKGKDRTFKKCKTCGHLLERD